MIRGVPYDVEVEYLRSSGEFIPYIDTLIDYFPDFELMVYIPEGVRNVTMTSGDYLLERIDSTNPYWRLYVGSDIRTRISVYGEHILSLRGNVFSVDGTDFNVSDRQWGSSRCYFPRNKISGYQIDYYYVKFWDNNNNLVRDFIPVRVGNTGYIYDRVTRKLFGNQGTGSFLLGPDVARPVMGLHLYPH